MKEDAVDAYVNDNLRQVQDDKVVNGLSSGGDRGVVLRQTQHDNSSILLRYSLESFLLKKIPLRRYAIICGKYPLIV